MFGSKFTKFLSFFKQKIFKFCTTLQCHETYLLCTILAEILGDIQKVRSLKIFEFWPPPPFPRVRPCSFSSNIFNISYCHYNICLIFHTAIIINRKTWRITIKLHFENLSILFKKQTYTHARTPPLPVRFCSLFNDPSSPILNIRAFWMTPYILSMKGGYQSTNWVKFHLSSWKSEILHFGGFLL